MLKKPKLFGSSNSQLSVTNTDELFGLTYKPAKSPHKTAFQIGARPPRQRGTLQTQSPVVVMPEMQTPHTVPTIWPSFSSSHMQCEEDVHILLTSKGNTKEGCKSGSHACNYTTILVG